MCMNIKYEDIEKDKARKIIRDGLSYMAKKNMMQLVFYMIWPLKVIIKIMMQE